jgi:putative FmdB family regulatory protein
MTGLPTYEYRCESCEKNFDVVQSFQDDPLTSCPTCGSPVRKVFGNVGIVFKGSGFYKTDSRNGSSSTKKTDGQAASSAGSESEGSSPSDNTKESSSTSSEGSSSPSPAGSSGTKSSDSSSKKETTTKAAKTAE